MKKSYHSSKKKRKSSKWFLMSEDSRVGETSERTPIYPCDPFLTIMKRRYGMSRWMTASGFALITLSRIIGPNLWASLADKSGKGLTVLRIGSFLTVVTFCLIFFVDGFWLLTLSFALMMMFWTAILPQIEVLTLNCVKSDSSRYSYIRLWGSIGFIY